MKIGTLLDNIDLGSMALPEFQRGYVWNRDQVRGFMASLYRRYPVGSLLVWATKTEPAVARGGGFLADSVVKLLLDGQQRITSLYGIIRGKPPKFFDGDVRTFTGLYFHLDEEAFEFYSPAKMSDNPLWINVTELMQDGVGGLINRLVKDPALSPRIETYIKRITAIAGIRDIDLHVEEVVGEDKTVDVVVEIFNRVNSGGTKLSKGDLALAKVCAEWPQARQEMRGCLSRWEKAGFSFKIDWLLRNINTILTGEALFSALKDVNGVTFQKGLKLAEDNCNYLLNMISGRLGLDHDRVLGGRYAFPVMTRYLYLHGGKIHDAREQDKLLYWYVNSLLWGRFAGSTESVLNKDLDPIRGTREDLDLLIEQLRQWRGSLEVRPEDFGGWSLGARFYPLLYLMTRVCGARDLGSGLPLTAHMLGKLSALQVHHIFPKAVLYKYGYQRSEVNAIANFCFLTQDTNLSIGAKNPTEYLRDAVAKYPGILESQWIPDDANLWKVEQYREFLARRRELLAAAANQFLNELLAGSSADAVVDYPTALSPSVSATVDEDAGLTGFLKWLRTKGLPMPERDYEISDPGSGAPLTIVDLAWPDGVQEGYSQPVALALGEDQDRITLLNRAGYRFFGDVEKLRDYIISKTS